MITSVQTPLTERQRKVINRILDEPGGFERKLTTRKYAAIAKVSPATKFHKNNIIEKSPCNMYKDVYDYSIQFTWHEAKRKANIKKHGIDFADASKVFAGPTFTFEDTRFDYGEQRWITIGLCNLSVVVIAHTETEDEIHIISMRKAEKHEHKIFFENL